MAYGPKFDQSMYLTEVVTLIGYVTQRIQMPKYPRNSGPTSIIPLVLKPCFLIVSVSADPPGFFGSWSPDDGAPVDSFEGEPLPGLHGGARGARPAGASHGSGGRPGLSVAWRLGTKPRSSKNPELRTIPQESEYRIDMVFEPNVLDVCGLSLVLMPRDMP